MRKSVLKFISFQQMIGSAIEDWEIVYRIHATRRMFERDISEEELMDVLINGHVIESYPDDTPFPSALVNGITAKGRHIHVVIANDIATKRLYVITVYVPSSSKWSENFSRRVK